MQRRAGGSVTVVVRRLSVEPSAAVVPRANMQRPRLRLLSNPVNEKVRESGTMDGSSDLDTFCDISPLA